MANTFTKIASVTVGAGGTGNITFSSIPSTYTDLVVFTSARINFSGVTAGFYINFNGDFTAGNYSRLAVYSDGSVQNFSANAVIQIGGATGNTATSNTFNSSFIYIPNYTSSNQKSVSSDYVSENNGFNWTGGLAASKWTGTSAINSIVIYSDGGNLMQYSTATLYGIKNS
jgi:hypothetical protein